jgi:hypothetical protein
MMQFAIPSYFSAIFYILFLRLDRPLKIMGNNWVRCSLVSKIEKEFLFPLLCISLKNYLLFIKITTKK